MYITSANLAIKYIICKLSYIFGRLRRRLKVCKSLFSIVTMATLFYRKKSGLLSDGKPDYFYTHPSKTNRTKILRIICISCIVLAAYIQPSGVVR